MATNSTERTSLLPIFSTKVENRRSCASILSNIFLRILHAFDSIVDWAPLIIVQILNGGYCSPCDAFFWGTVAGALLLVYTFLRMRCRKRHMHPNQGSEVYPKTLDLGQFLLLGFLWVLTFLFKENEYIEKLFVLWFNPFTTGGIAFIMWASILRGRPFVLEIVQSQMPPAVWKKLSARKWFMEILTESAWFWVHILGWMTVIVAIQPFLVTLFYGGVVNATMSNLGNLLTGGQFLILFYGINENNRRYNRNKQQEARDIKERGLDKEMLKLHWPPVKISVSDIDASGTTEATLAQHSHHIRSLKSETHLNHAGRVITDAFQNVEALEGYLDNQEDKKSLITATFKAISYFNYVLGCFEGSSSDNLDSFEPKVHNIDNSCPRCIIACIPVLSRSQDEINVYNSFEAWLEHGFKIQGATETDFPIPDEYLFSLRKMKNKRDNGLTKRPYIYIAYFGADPAYAGKGYGRSLLRYIVEVSETKKLPLVLETTTAFNISQYKRYGFRVVDRVQGRPEWVLMVREVEKETL